VGGERIYFYEYNKPWECYSASQCIGKHCSIPREQKIVGELLWMAFMIFLKFREQTPYKKAVVNALMVEHQALFPFFLAFGLVLIF
jgi:hypothetical protein